MNFSWVIPGVLAGSMGPVIEEELEYLKKQGIKAIVRLEQHTISGESAGFVDLAEFVPDFHATTMGQMDRIIAFIREQAQQSLPVVICCKAGMGRTGTVLACYLLHDGYSAEDAIVRVRSLRRGSVESPFQQEFVYSYEERLRQVPG